GRLEGPNEIAREFEVAKLVDPLAQQTKDLAKVADAVKHAQEATKLMEGVSRSIQGGEQIWGAVKKEKSNDLLRDAETTGLKSKEADDRAKDAKDDRTAARDREKRALDAAVQMQRSLTQSPA